MYPCFLGLRNGKRLGEGGIHIIWCLALLHSFQGCHQCKSNPANLLPYGLCFGWSCFGGVLHQLRLVSANQGNCFLGLLRLEGGHWVAYLFCRVLSAVRSLRLFGRDGYVCFKLPLCLSRYFFSMFFEAVFVVSIKADPALGAPYGNDLQSPGPRTV